MQDAIRHKRPQQKQTVCDERRKPQHKTIHCVKGHITRRVQGLNQPTLKTGRSEQATFGAIGFVNASRGRGVWFVGIEHLERFVRVGKRMHPSVEQQNRGRTRESERRKATQNQ
jgi:hypothetical protein